MIFEYVRFGFSDVKGAGCIRMITPVNSADIDIHLFARLNHLAAGKRMSGVGFQPGKDGQCDCGVFPTGGGVVDEQVFLFLSVAEID